MQNFRISWNEDVIRHFHTGVDRGMIYIPGAAGIPWNGLQEVVESSPDSVMSQLYQDGQRILVNRRDLNYETHVKAFTYPTEFEPYTGYSPSLLKPFSFSYRVMTSETTYRIHLVYNVVAIPDDVVFSSIADEIDPISLGWRFVTRPIKLSGLAPSSHIIIDTENAHSWTIEALEDQLYGGEGIIPNLPNPSEIDQIFQDNAILKVVDNGDGTATITGPDDAVFSAGPNKATVDWVSVVKTSPTTINISSY